jgi:hypothetical protein
MIGRTPKSLGDRIVRLEAGRKKSGGSDLFLVWGKNPVDLKRKIKHARSAGELKSGDRFWAGIWPSSTEMPASRRTSVFAMFEDLNGELEAWLGTMGHKRPGGPCHPNPDLLEFSSEQLCEIVASHLPRCEG